MDLTTEQLTFPAEARKRKQDDVAVKADLQGQQRLGYRDKNGRLTAAGKEAARVAAAAEKKKK